MDSIVFTYCKYKRLLAICNISTFILTVRYEVQKNLDTNKTFALWKTDITETAAVDGYEMSYELLRRK